jgi:hypothetical protein
LAKCGVCQFHIFAFASRKMRWTNWKALNTVEAMEKIAPHFAVENQF